MIFQNQQANILRVNGALADNFANRPASQGTYYIFYSLDTQEIFYDDVSGWIKLGSGGGGGGVNIYNSDGTLTANRTLDGANNDLNLADLNIFKTSIGGNDKGLKLDFANNFYQLGDLQTFNYLQNFPGGTQVYINGNPLLSVTTANYVTIGDEQGNINYTTLWVDVNNEKIFTFYQGNDIGLKLDFANANYSLGDPLGLNNATYITINDGATKNIILAADENNINTRFTVDATTQFISTIYQSNEIGLKLDFANSVYQFGQINGGNQTYLEIDDTNQILTTKNNTFDNGITFQYAAKIYSFGQNTNGNLTSIQIDDNAKSIILESCVNVVNDYTALLLNGGANAKIRTQYQSQNSGFNFEYDIRKFQFGQIGDVTTNRTFFEIDDTNQIIKTSKQGNELGLKLDFAARTYKLGQISNIVGTNYTYLDINDTSQIISSNNQGSTTGIKLDFGNAKFQFGQITGPTPTYLTIKEGAAFPLQIDGTNVLQGTSGPVSGQHLKVKVNGVDYVIELKNP